MVQVVFGSFLLQVTDALRKEGLESSNLIVGIDFTKSNEWTGSWMYRKTAIFIYIYIYIIKYKQIIVTCISLKLICCCFN